MDYQRQLAKEYSKIIHKLNDPNVSEKYLDDLLEVFSYELASIEESKGNWKNQKQLYRNLKRVQDNKFNAEIHLTKDQKVQGAFDKLQAVYEREDNLTNEESPRIVKSLKPYIDTLIETDFNDYEIDDDFREFLENIISMSTNKPGYKITKIHDEETQEPIHERFTSYFNEPRTKEVKHKALDESFNTYYEANLLLAIKNSGICGQIELNRIKSLGTGKHLTESIKAVIPARKHSHIKYLHEIQEQRHQDYLEAQKSLI